MNQIKDLSNSKALSSVYKPDIEAFTKLWSDLRSFYEGTNVTKTIARLLHVYQPEDGVLVYAKLLRTLYAMLANFERKGFCSLASMVPVPKGVSEATIDKVFFDNTGHHRLKVPVLRFHNPAVANAESQICCKPDVSQSCTNVMVNCNPAGFTLKRSADEKNLPLKKRKSLLINECQNLLKAEIKNEAQRGFDNEIATTSSNQSREREFEKLKFVANNSQYNNRKENETSDAETDQFADVPNENLIQENDPKLDFVQNENRLITKTYFNSSAENKTCTKSKVFKVTSHQDLFTFNKQLKTKVGHEKVDETTQKKSSRRKRPEPPTRPRSERVAQKNLLLRKASIESKHSFTTTYVERTRRVANKINKTQGRSGCSSSVEDKMAINEDQPSNYLIKMEPSKKQGCDTTMAIQRKKIAVANSLAISSLTRTTCCYPYYINYFHRQHNMMQQCLMNPYCQSNCQSYGQCRVPQPAHAVYCAVNATNHKCSMISSAYYQTVTSTEGFSNTALTKNGHKHPECSNIYPEK